MTKPHAAVLMGGTSAERKVSLRSGRTAVLALRAGGLEVTPVDVKGPDFELPARADVAFLALHGSFGEDGQVQKILEDRGVAFTGSDSVASAQAFDKSVAKTVFAAAGVPTPAYALVNGDLSVVEQFGFPVIVKPSRQGSSVGVSVVKKRAGIAAAVRAARKFDECVLAENYIKGRELTVGILDGRTLPVVEIRTNHDFFDPEAKYVPGEAEELVPAPLTPEVTAAAQRLALQAHAALGCRDVSRVDIMMNGAGEMFVLEVNTLPGMTDNSLLPKAAAAAGLSMVQVCTRLVELALARQPAAVAA